ncbi:MAG: hypothetical protein O6849_06850 [Candidatus Dadabacteria bacterium]|nr:hypothetical protein [Candidatus Dadabacteria bacterium]MCZ6685680.1 hypothetical protein [Candidatus Dadabacteria bacterium]
MNPKNKKFLLRMIISIFFISIFTVGSCDIEFGGTGGGGGGGSGSGDIIIEGTILNSSEFGEITVSAFRDNFRLDRTTTDIGGNFTLQFRTSSEIVTLKFESDSFDAERPNIRVVDNSTSMMDITLQQNPVLITIDRWQVFQDTLSLSGDTELEFIESIVEFNIEANGGNCIFATGTSLITYRVKSINITECREGIRAQVSASIILEADESIVISSDLDAILTLDDSIVEIGQSSNPINNTVIIESANQFGINAAGNSIVTIDPENTCSISGGRGAVNINTNASVDTSTCTLSL